MLQARAETEEWSFLKEQPYSLSTSTGSDGLVYIEVRQNSEDTMLSSHVTSFRINGKGELEEENQTRTGYEVIASEYGDTGLE